MTLLLGTLSGQEFRKAVDALAAGDLVRAEQGFKTVLKTEPSHIGALGNLGVVYSRLERIDDAIAIYRRALRLAPNEPGLMLNLSLAYLKAENYQAAKPLLAKLAPRSIQARELLATCQVFTHEEGAALKTLAGMDDTTGILYLRGVAHLKTGQKAEAEAAFQRMLTEAASPAQARFLLGKAYLENALFDEATVEFRKALELDPGMPGASIELGKAYLGQRNDEAAEQSFRAELSRNPNNPEALYYLGAIGVLAHREAGAIPLLERARTLRPGGWGSYYYLGRAQLQLGHAREAVPFLEKAAQLNPTEGAIQYQLARAYQSAGRPADAERARARVQALKQSSLEKEERVFSNSSPR